MFVACPGTLQSNLCNSVSKMDIDVFVLSEYNIQKGTKHWVHGIFHKVYATLYSCTHHFGETDCAKITISCSHLMVD